MTKEKVGVVGTGFIARGLSYSLREDPSLQISRVLTRRDPATVVDMAVERKQLTRSVRDLARDSSLVVICTGDPIYGTDVAAEILAAGLPVVTMDAELQITTGSWLQKQGLLTEAEGDQPGCLAALNREAVAMGFTPLVFSNIKGFLDHTPTREQAKHWATRNGISLANCVAFTDGTKVQVEQALVANGLKAQIARQGLMGVECVDYRDGAVQLARMAESLGAPISDYVLSAKSPAGVFIVATHQIEQRPYLAYYKLGDGPYYVLTKPFHLCHLELVKTIRQVLRGGGVLLNNGETPTASVATIAKRRLVPGERVSRGIGSFDVRGEAIRIADAKDHLPIGLCADVVVRKFVEPGQTITFGDVDIPPSLALTAWREMVGER